MNWLHLLSIIPSILQVIASAEVIITGARQGKAKKEMVMRMVSEFLGILVKLDRIKPDEVQAVQDAMGSLIDKIVGVFNVNGLFSKSG